MQQATAKEAAAKEEARKERERADRLERELLDARKPATTARPADPAPAARAANAPPALKSFVEQIGTTYESWEEANEAWADARDAWKDEQREWKVAFDDIDRAKATDPEFARAISNLPCSPVMGQAIRDSKNRLDILRYLGTHPEECIQLAQESARTSLDAASVVRRHLETLVTASAVAKPDSASVVRPSTAKPPVNRVGGTASATPVDPEDLEFGPEYIRAENARERKRQEAARW